MDSQRSGDAALVMAIITLAHNLREVTLRVETEEHLVPALCRERHRGYLFVNPMPAEAFRTLWLTLRGQICGNRFWNTEPVLA